MSIEIAVTMAETSAGLQLLTLSLCEPYLVLLDCA